MEKNSEIKDEKVDVVLEKKNFFSRISLFEKIFWLVIIIMSIVYLIAQLIAFSNMQSYSDKKIPIITKYVAKENLEKYKDNISIDFQNRVSIMDMAVDNEIDKLFNRVENNLDNFLDFHYSIKGEYIELSAIITKDIGELITDKLFGEEFNKEVQDSLKTMNDIYKLNMKEHLKLIDNYALEKIDLESNANSLQTLHDEINTNKNIQEGKAGVLLLAGFSSRVIQAITTKLAAKVASKVAIKTGRLAASSVAGASGIVCGPFVVVCAPTAAIITWFATDAIIISGDEYFNREELKQELLEELNENKLILKQQYKSIYFDTMNQISQESKKSYENTKILVKDKF
ncbi:MAG: hypothetical protein U5K55_01015 [Aliarcobacter sp.]|nr:hypothetical protein [Aliarcobacter sp.]